MADLLLQSCSMNFWFSGVDSGAVSRAVRHLYQYVVTAVGKIPKKGKNVSNRAKINLVRLTYGECRSIIYIKDWKEKRSKRASEMLAFPSVTRRKEKGSLSI
ncbi:MAG: hypothetical protein SPC78_00535 [Candidatus Faecousia sp.]|nr:hypothetical protein [Candidatus Faecousia sp.]